MVVTLVISVLVVFLWLQAKPLLQRRLIVSETRIGIERQRAENERMALLKPTVKDEDPMPQDMIDWAMNESFDWARDDKLSRMRELYGKFHDWQKVRNALMVEEESNNHNRTTF